MANTDSRLWPIPVKLPKLSFGALTGSLWKDAKKRYAVVWTVVFLLIIAVNLGIFGVLNSKLQKTEGQLKDFRARTRLMAELNLTGASAAKIMQEIENNSALEASMTVMPGDMATIFSAVSNSASAHRVTIRKVGSMPLEDLKNFPYTRVPISIELEGDYARVGDFIGELSQKISWFFSLDTVRMSASLRFDGTVVAELKISFYSKVTV